MQQPPPTPTAKNERERERNLSPTLLRSNQVFLSAFGLASLYRVYLFCDALGFQYRSFQLSSLMD